VADREAPNREETLEEPILNDNSKRGTRKAIVAIGAIAAALSGWSAISVNSATAANPYGQPIFVVRKLDCAKQYGVAGHVSFEFEVVGDTEIGDDQGNHLILHDGWHIFGNCMQLGHEDTAATGPAGAPTLVFSPSDSVQLWENFISGNGYTGPAAGKVIDDVRWGLQMRALPQGGATSIGNRVTVPVQLFVRAVAPGTGAMLPPYSGPNPIFQAN